MMRHRLVLATAISFGLVGCVLTPTTLVTQKGSMASESGGGTSDPVSTSPAGETASTSEYGALTLSVRWPQQTGYQTALLPTSTNALGITVKQGSTTLAQEVITRQPGQTTATASLTLKAANNLSVEVKAYRESNPDLATAVPIAQKSGTFNVSRSKNTAANLTLDPMNVPTVGAMSSNVGVMDDTILLTGTNFGSGSIAVPTVSFNGVHAVFVTRNSETQLTVKVPPSAVTGKVVVTADGVNSTSDAVFWVPKSLAISSAKETWDQSPTAERLIMFGKTLQFSASPTWDYKVGDTTTYGTPPSPTWGLSNPLAGAIDASGLYTATHSYQVTNVSASLGSLQSTAQSVKLVADAPVISSITPTNGGLSSSQATGPKTVVTINGSGFGDGENATLRVFLGTTEFTDFTRVSDAQITFQLPSYGLQTGQVKVVSYGVTSTNKPTFQVIQSLFLSPSGTSLNLPLGGTQQYTVSGTDTVGNTVAAPNVTWASSATASATVSQTGLLTAVDYGTANPMVQSGALQAWGSPVTINYNYTVQGGTGPDSNSVYGSAYPRYYSQSFSTTQGRTFKALDAGVVPADDSDISLEIRSDSGGYPSGTVVASRTASKKAGLPGNVYVFNSPLTLPAGSYHLVQRVPANTAHYVYYFRPGGTGVGVARESLDGSTWGAITTVPPNTPESLFFRLGE